VAGRPAMTAVPMPSAGGQEPRPFQVLALGIQGRVGVVLHRPPHPVALAVPGSPVTLKHTLVARNTPDNCAPPGSIAGCKN